MVFSSDSVGYDRAGLDYEETFGMALACVYYSCGKINMCSSL